jgi:methionyl aminopeptidase
VKDADTIARMRVAGRIAAEALAEVGRHVAPGVTTDELDRVGHDFLVERSAYPSTLGYKGFPKSLCTSVNEVVCHGIPDSTELREGDIVNVDITAFIGGVHGDTDATFLVGEVAEEDRLLVERTEEALRRAIRAVRPGRPINVIGRVIESYARGSTTAWSASSPATASGPRSTPGWSSPTTTTPARPADRGGMTFTIEPMLNLGTHEWEMWDDGWTVVTRDRRKSAQFEHTILVTDGEPEILTLPG